MKILFYGDSITDMGRSKEFDHNAFGYGVGYVQHVAGTLLKDAPDKYDIVNRGVSGNRIVDLYARIKGDVWNLEPDVLSILIGINDVWHDLSDGNGVELERFDRIYRMLLDDTKKRLPDIKFILCEPFVLEGTVTSDRMEKFLQIKEYAKAVKKIAEDYHCAFVALQEKFDAAAKKYGAAYYLYDGVHPDAAGAKLIADEWLKIFQEKIDK